VTELLIRDVDLVTKTDLSGQSMGWNIPDTTLRTQPRHASLGLLNRARWSSCL